MRTDCSEATRKAIGDKRAKLAEVRCVVENAITQMLAGNTKDPYNSFRPFAKEVAEAGGNLDAYIDDLRMIKTSFAKHTDMDVAEAFVKSTDTWGDGCKLLTRSICHLDGVSAQNILKALSAHKNVVDDLYDAVWRQVGLETSTRDFARAAVENRRAA